MSRIEKRFWVYLHGPRARRRRKDLDEGGTAVEPNNPKDLSGGAAAALEFGD